jgi:3-hydroxyacyl-[acyl-carrier-protein] dehydratase
MPGDRLVMMAALEKIRRGALVTSRFQGFVRETMVCEGVIKGVPLPEAAIEARRARDAEGRSTGS